MRAHAFNPPAWYPICAEAYSVRESGVLGLPTSCHMLRNDASYLVAVAWQE